MVRLMSMGLMALALCVFGVASADEKKDGKKVEEAKLTGKITCAKCDLGEAKACATVIVVTEKKDGKESKVTYYFDKDSHKKHHGPVCQGAKEGTVKGETKKDGDKMVVTVTDLEFKK